MMNYELPAVLKNVTLHRVSEEGELHDCAPLKGDLVWIKKCGQLKLWDGVQLVPLVLQVKSG